jgi:hypothetical protein
MLNNATIQALAKVIMNNKVAMTEAAAVVVGRATEEVVRTKVAKRILRMLSRCQCPWPQWRGQYFGGVGATFKVKRPWNSSALTQGILSSSFKAVMLLQP